MRGCALPARLPFRTRHCFPALPYCPPFPARSATHRNPPPTHTPSSIAQGLRLLIPAELVRVFNENELELLICGLPHIDVDELQAHTEYQGYTQTSQQASRRQAARANAAGPPPTPNTIPNTPHTHTHNARRTRFPPPDRCAGSGRSCARWTRRSARGSSSS